MAKVGTPTQMAAQVAASKLARRKQTMTERHQAGQRRVAERKQALAEHRQGYKEGADRRQRAEKAAKEQAAEREGQQRAAADQRRKAVSGARKAGRTIAAATAPRSVSSARRLLVAEFLVCTVIIGLSPLIKPGAMEAGAWMRKISAVCLLFFVLGLTSGAGLGASRLAAGFGGIVTLALLLVDESIFVVLAGKVSSGGASSGTFGAPAAPLGKGSGDAGVSYGW